MEWYSPWALLLLLVLPFLGYVMLRRKRGAAVKFPSLVDMRDCPVSWRLRLRPVLVALRLLCLALLILALARPRKGTVLSEISTEGVALETVVDHSGSMSAEMDYYGEKLNRLEVVKRVLADFIEGDKGTPNALFRVGDPKKGLGGRTGDMIGLVSFARYADTICPLVLSHGVLAEFLKQTQIVSVKEEDGTAIGDAIALAAARLKKAEEEIQHRNVQLGFGSEGSAQKNNSPTFQIKSKAIILLTDGLDNASRYRSPLDAAELARRWGIRVYTIGIGSGQAYRTVQTPLGTFRMRAEQELDEKLLKAIAEKTGGFYSRADDAEALREIVKKIDELEKTEVKSVQYMQYAEHFSSWTLPALVLLGLEMLAGCTLFRKIP
jgi:Ca-activated chloride channel family protein